MSQVVALLARSRRTFGGGAHAPRFFTFDDGEDHEIHRRKEGMTVGRQEVVRVWRDMATRGN